MLVRARWYMLWGYRKDEKKVGSMGKSNDESGTLTCPFCSEAKLRGSGRNSLRCDECGGVLGGALLETLHRIVALPDAAGGHACECGHPEMRRLPDSVFRCPACRSEVTPVTAPVSWKSPDHTDAYWSGWLDGRYGDPEQFTNNRRLAKWEDASDRLDYYRGHRAGHEARLRKVRLVEAS
jgi:ribosomal protein L37AE/L43A